MGKTFETIKGNVGETVKTVATVPVHAAMAGVETFTGKNPIPAISASVKNAMKSTVSLPLKVVTAATLGMAGGALRLLGNVLKFIPIPVPKFGEKVTRSEVTGGTAGALQGLKKQMVPFSPARKNPVEAQNRAA